MPLVRLENFQPFQVINVLLDPGAIGGPVQVPNAAQIVFRFGLESGKYGVCVLYGRYAGSFAGSVAQANAILAAMTSGAAWTALAAFLATSTGFNNLSIRDVNTPNSAVIDAAPAGAPGTSASAALPAEVAACVTFRTDKTGPRYRGRMYIPGFATNALGSGNVIAAAAVTAINNWVATIPTAFSAQGYTHVLGLRARAAYTGSTGTQHPAMPAETRTVTTRTLRDNHWDSQRRRGLK